MRYLLIALLLLPTAAKADLSLAAFYDVERRLAIAEANWFYKLPGKWASYGFLEAYRNPAEGYPPESNVLFGKTWVMRDISKAWSFGLELEHGYNNAGMYSRTKPFQPDEFRVLPKIGFSVKIQ